MRCRIPERAGQVSTHYAGMKVQREVPGTGWRMSPLSEVVATPGSANHSRPHRSPKTGTGSRTSTQRSREGAVGYGLDWRRRGGRPEANEITRFAAGSRATAHVSRTAAVPVKA